MKNIFMILFIFFSFTFSIYAQLKTLANPKNFEIGPCIAMDPLRNETQYRNTIIAEFNTAVAENAFKMYMWTGPNSYNFNDTDYLVNFCRQNGIKLRGHTLVWHSVVPSWLQNGNYTTDQVRQMLQTYITTVVTRYKNDIYEWDVVNEAISDSSPHGLRTDSFWYQKLGPDFIRLAFQWAHQADPDCKLYYNDYGAEDMGGKSNGVYNLVSQLKQEGVPIHGVGWQCHFYYDWRLNQTFYENLERIKALGLDVKVTELDMSIPLPVEPQELQVQARGYADMAYFCLSNKIGMVLWGFTDKHSWIPGFTNGERGAALIFDENYNKKPAYYAIESVLKATVNGAIYNCDFENGVYCWFTNGTCSISTTTAQRRS
ncbi:MAG: endo-1,4-beta-xylanase, partial [Endomicrobia bacterium]|nr:endo-1,4-beta-xylanase [Endomicrobiia bacterium]